MFRSIPRPSPALVVACLALVAALTGTSYADVLNVPFNSVGTRQLKANAVFSQPFDGGGGWLIQTARGTPADSVLLGYAICQ
jgi:hypothetical protein